MVYKWCVVPKCSSTSIKTPEKLFVPVPIDPERRKKWLSVARRNPETVGPNSSVYMCEDHFNLPNDMENYMQYHVMGSVSKVRMKPGCTPSKFECQVDRKKRTGCSAGRPYFLKKQQKMIIEECLNQPVVPEETCTRKISAKDASVCSATNLPNDMQNYMQYHVMGSVSQVRMKPGCTPSKFECQEGRRKSTGSSAVMPNILRKQREMTITECMEEPEVVLEESATTSTSDTSVFATNPDYITCEENKPEISEINLGDEEETSSSATVSVKEEMFAEFCHGCLSRDRQLQALGENQDLFFYLLGPDFVEQEPLNALLCWECSTILRKTSRLQQQIQQIYEYAAIQQSLDLQSLPSLSTLGECHNQPHYIIQHTSNTFEQGPLKKNVETPETDLLDTVDQEIDNEYENKYDFLIDVETVELVKDNIMLGENEQTEQHDARSVKLKQDSDIENSEKPMKQRHPVDQRWNAKKLKSISSETTDENIVNTAAVHFKDTMEKVPVNKQERKKTRSTKIIIKQPQAANKRIQRNERPQKCDNMVDEKIQSQSGPAET